MFEESALYTEWAGRRKVLTSVGGTLVAIALAISAFGMIMETFSGSLLGGIGTVMINLIVLALYVGVLVLCSLERWGLLVGVVALVGLLLLADGDGEVGSALVLAAGLVGAGVLGGNTSVVRRRRG